MVSDWVFKIKQKQLAATEDPFVVPVDYYYSSPTTKINSGQCNERNSTTINQTLLSQKKTIAFTEQDTRHLVYSISKIYHTNIVNVLLMGLSIALTQWTGRSSYLLSIKGYGRNIPTMHQCYQQLTTINDGYHHLQSSVGCFDGIYNVYLDLSRFFEEKKKENYLSDDSLQCLEFNKALKSIKNQMTVASKLWMGTIHEQVFRHHIREIVDNIEECELIEQVVLMPQDILFNYIGQEVKWKTRRLQ